MFNNKRYFKHLIILIVVISISTNLVLALQLKSLKENVSSSNLVISTRVESSVRSLMLSIKELKETGAREDMQELQRSAQQLLLTFNNWIDLNQTKKNTSESLMNGLTGFESLRNTVVHHLNNQYSAHNHQLTNYDKVLLDKIYEQLDRFLVLYYNIQERADEIKSPENGDGGLSQWASNMNEISRLYRHSRIPNEHPKYTELNSVLINIHKMFPNIDHLLESKELIEKAKEDVQIVDGVHYYEISYYIKDELAYLIKADAISGFVRHFEDFTQDDGTDVIFKDKALNIARDFLNRFNSYEDVVYGATSIVDDATQNTIYSFRFIPVLGDVTVNSDIVKINISSKSGKVIKYSNDFNKTMSPILNKVEKREDIEEKYKDQIADMEYMGMAIIRSFHTHYKPVMTYSYQVTEKEEIRKLYFDISTGNQVHETYSVYEPVTYISMENNN